MALLFICISAGARGGDSNMDRATLRGLKAMKVVVDAATPDMERIGLTQDHLRTDIEEKLRGAGINVSNDAQEFLGLGISTSPARRGPQPVSMELAVYQVVQLNRNKTTKTVAPTWSLQRVLLLPSRQVGRIVPRAMDDLVSQFIQAYREVNAGAGP